MNTLINLFLVFARIGGFTFGGGYAMLPLLQKEVVEKRNWATQEELMDYYAIGQCTPGIIAVNTATFVGYKIKGIAGAIFASLGVIAPSIVIVGIIAAFISNFQDLQVVQWAFSGIRAAVVALITSSIIKLAKKSVIDIMTFILFISITILSFFTDISPIIFIVSAGICGLIFNIAKSKNIREESDK